MTRSAVRLRVILACGYESRGLDDARKVAVGRGLSTAIGTEPTCIVPMTLGRDPKLIAECGRAARASGSDQVMVSEPFGTATHLIAWLRAATRSADLLITSPASDPYNDAELFRIARLVKQFSNRELVEVAFDGGDPSVEDGLARCHKLGAIGLEQVPATFELLSSAAIKVVVDQRVAAAAHRFSHGDNGIHAALHAEDNHGHAHSHGPGSDHHHH